MYRLNAAVGILLGILSLSCSSDSRVSAGSDTAPSEDARDERIPDSSEQMTADAVTPTADIPLLDAGTPGDVTQDPDGALSTDAASQPDMGLMSDTASGGSEDVSSPEDIADTPSSSACLGTEIAFELPQTVTFDDLPDSFLDMYQSVTLVDVSPGLGVGSHTVLLRLWDFVECLDGGCDPETGAQSPPGVVGAKFIVGTSCSQGNACTNTWHHVDSYEGSTDVIVTELGNGYYQLAGLLIPSAGSWEFRFAINGWPMAIFHFCVKNQMIPGGDPEGWPSPDDGTDGFDMSDAGDGSGGADASSGTDGADSST